MAVDVQRALQAFVALAGQAGGLELFYGALNTPTETAKIVLYVTQTLVGDTFVVRPTGLVLVGYNVLSPLR